MGSTDSISINALAEHIVSKADTNFEPIYRDLKDADAKRTHVDVSEARDLLGSEPANSIKDGVSKFIDWYRENRDWYEPLVLDA